MIPVIKTGLAFGQLSPPFSSSLNDSINFLGSSSSNCRNTSVSNYDPILTSQSLSNFLPTSWIVYQISLSVLWLTKRTTLDVRVKDKEKKKPKLKKNPLIIGQRSEKKFRRKKLPNWVVFTLLAEKTGSSQFKILTIGVSSLSVSNS